MKQDETLESILKEANEPRVEVFLDEKRRQFLRQYANERQRYNESLFARKEQKIIMEVLDDLFSSYILKQEHAGYKLSLYAKKVLDEKEGVDKHHKYLQELGGNIFDNARSKE